MAATEISAEGAKESRSIIKQFHACLNSPELVPEQAYRRNSGLYPLVCYINNIGGLFLSKNYDAIPIFVARAAEYFASSPSTPASFAYYEVVNKYLRQVVFHLRHFVEGIEHWDDRIPPSILEAGPQKLEWPK